MYIVAGWNGPHLIQSGEVDRSGARYHIYFKNKSPDRNPRERNTTT